MACADMVVGEDTEAQWAPVPPQGTLPRRPLQPGITPPQVKTVLLAGTHGRGFLPGPRLSPWVWCWLGRGGRAYIPACLPTPCQVTRTVEGRRGRGQVGVNKWGR